MTEREHETEEQDGEQKSSADEEREAWDETNDDPAAGEQGQDAV